MAQPLATYEEVEAEDDDEFGREAGGNNYSNQYWQIENTRNKSRGTLNGKSWGKQDYAYDNEFKNQSGYDMDSYEGGYTGIQTYSKNTKALA